MEQTTIILTTLVLYMLTLIGIGFWARSRTRTNEDFFLGGRSLGPIVGGISYSCSASSAFALLGLSGASYVIGVSVFWIICGSIIGATLSWVWIAPRLMAFSNHHQHLTLTDVLVHSCSGTIRTVIVRTASVIIVFTFVFYVAAQFQGAGNTFSSTFNLPMMESILIGATIITIYTLLGGFWAVSVTDTLQGLLMAFTAILLPIVALVEIGGFGEFLTQLLAVSSPQQLSWTAGNAGLVAVGVIIGSLSISFGAYGQPHIMVRFMAMRDEKALRQARMISIAWYVVVYVGMCALGLMGHILVPMTDNPESIFFVLTANLFPPVLAGILLAAVLSAVMSTADSQLLVSGSAVAHDLGIGTGDARHKLLVSRIAIIGLVLLSSLVALFLPETIFSRVLVAWVALGAAFGPTLIFRLARIPLKPFGVLLSIVTGFVAASTFYLMPDTPGDILERLVPFVLATSVLVVFRQRPSANPGSLLAGR